MKNTHKVIINEEGQYSLWPVNKENAPGWKDTGKSGSNEECFAFIKENWLDMRPLSLKKQMVSLQK